MYVDRVPTCIPRNGKETLLMLTSNIYHVKYFSYLPWYRKVLETGETPLVFNKDVDIGLCKCRSYNWRIQNEVVKATQNHCERRGGRYSFITATDYFCALWLGAYRKLWSILKNVEMNHNKRALTRNRCQWSVYISWPEKGRYIYTCTTLRKQFFYCVLKSSRHWIKIKLSLRVTLNQAEVSTLSY